MATPTVAAIRRCGSRVAASDITTKVTWPGSRRFIPWLRDRIRHLGGKMLDTRTRLHAAIPADRSASSNEVSFSRCFPTPFVKYISLGTNPTTSRSLRVRARRKFRADMLDVGPQARRFQGKTRKSRTRVLPTHGKHQLSQCQGTEEPLHTYNS